MLFSVTYYLIYIKSHHVAVYRSFIGMADRTHVFLFYEKYNTGDVEALPYSTYSAALVVHSKS